MTYDYDFHRYLGQNENKEINEKCYDLELDIEDAEERHQKANEKSEAVSNIDKRVKTGLHKLGNALSLPLLCPNRIFPVSILVDSNETHKPTLKILRMCEENIDLLFKRLLGVDLEEIVEEIESQGWKPEGEAGPGIIDTFA